MSTLPARSAPGRLLLHGVDWRTYTRLLRLFEDRPSVRLTYERGSLEIMSPTDAHESDADFLGRLAVTLTEELGLPLKAGGSTTLRRRRRRRGLEPDKCYWIGHESTVRGKRRIDLRTDPPPDLVIEVDVTSRSLNRMGIYAALGVPEVWRLDRQILTFHALDANGAYAALNRSLLLPLVTPSDLSGFLVLRATLDENAVAARFRAWVRQQMAGPSP